MGKAVAVLRQVRYFSSFTPAFYSVNSRFSAFGAATRAKFGISAQFQQRSPLLPHGPFQENGGELGNLHKLAGKLSSCHFSEAGGPPPAWYFS